MGQCWRRLKTLADRVKPKRNVEQYFSRNLWSPVVFNVVGAERCAPPLLKPSDETDASAYFDGFERTNNIWVTDGPTSATDTEHHPFSSLAV